MVANKEYALRLYDANNKMISEKKLQTNDFGSFTTEFLLPGSTLNGRFRLETDFGSTIIRVEEYKRPTFEITFQPLEGSYTFNDSVTAYNIYRQQFPNSLVANRFGHASDASLLEIENPEEYRQTPKVSF